MPVIDVCWVGALAADADVLSQRLADVVGDALGVAPGRVWVRLAQLPANHYAENGGHLQGPLPLFVRVLHAHPPEGRALQAEITALTTALAAASGRPAERVHLEYAPAGVGRIAFGGRLAE
ncbi:MAG: hypothetical protein HY020_00985 [Burkholderiales bacterium]|nr:hypothetical protein [Burkholderiales bacterium]